VESDCQLVHHEVLQHLGAHGPARYNGHEIKKYTAPSDRARGYGLEGKRSP
jgi:hypothetical protein